MSIEFMLAYVGAIKANNRMVKLKHSLNGLRITRVGLTNYEVFEDCKKVWDMGNTMDDDQFVERFRREVCTEWSKNDEFGVPYAGEFWISDEASMSTASSLTEEKNARMICSLPYPHLFKLWFIENVLCPTRDESVQSLNSYCTFIADIISRI